MTDEEFVEEMRKTFEYSKTVWMAVSGGNEKTSKAIFYLSALHKIENEPFDIGFDNDRVVSYIQEKLDESFAQLSTFDVEDMFCALDELGYLKSES